MELEPWAQEAGLQNLLERRSRRLPVCDLCGEAIQEETYVRLRGCRYCSRCVRRNTFPTEQE